MASFDDKNDSEKLFPLPIYHEDDDSTTETTINEGRSRGRGRPPVPYRGRSRGRRGGYHGDKSSKQDNGIDNSRDTSNQRGRLKQQGRGRGLSRGRVISMNGRENSDVNTGLDHSRKRSVSRERTQEPEFMTNCPGSDSSNPTIVKNNRKPSNFKGNILRLLKTEDANTVVLDIVQSRSGFVEFMSKIPEPKSMFNIIHLLCKVTESSLLVHRREVMEEVEKSFIYSLTEILNKISLKDKETDCIWHSTENLSKFLTNVSKLISMVITTLPSSLGKCKSVITAMKEVQMEHNLSGLEDTLSEVEEIFKREKEAKQKSDEVNKIGKQTTANSARGLPAFEEIGPPPDNFRDIPIFPTLKDLQIDEKPFLRANKAKGKYDSLDTYLDVQFRLLREDYVQPLRKGVAEYRKAIKEGVKIERLRDIRLYHGVQLLRPVCSGRGIDHILQFDTTNFKKVNWTASRRLLYGSLVCLSKDHFNSFCYATVTERNAKDLSDGYIQVYFEKNEDMIEILPDDVFIMAETTAYFEAFRYVLEGLQEINEKMPLQRYIIECNTSLKPPLYLQHADETQYDFTCLLNNVATNAKFPVLKTQHWPSASDLGLDPSQYEAIIKAITQELAIIQGPPGTGKTFVGLKITELLLNNSKAWKRRQESPILVVCYTNHALDQFLEGILGLPDVSIVRIGGRCKSDTLQDFILKNLKLKRKEEKKRSFRVMQCERDCRSKLKDSEREIVHISNKLKRTSSKIMSYNVLSPFMTEEQRNAFEDDTLGEFSDNCLSKWLGFVSSFGDFEIDEQSESDRLKHVWKLAILENVTDLPDFERKHLRYVWDLELSRRAELYKSWISEFKENIRRTMTDKSGHSDLYQSWIFKADDTILDIETLLKYLSKDSTRIQVQMLIAGQIVSSKDVILRWLELAGKKKSMTYIRSALETIAYNDSVKHETEDDDIEEDQDLEEERQLDEEDDLLYGYDSKSKDERLNLIKDDGEWLVKFNERKCAHRVKNMFNSATKLSAEKAGSYENVWNLPSHIRQSLYCYWVQLLRQKLKADVKIHEEDFSKATEKLAEVRDMETLEVLKEANIMGMTTTGAAKYRKLLQFVRPKIIIVEEAAEVLESHIITTLNPNCQHLILIGDHKQLRPSTTVYELSRKYDMDISLFERMVRNEVPCVTLQEQHRMRPEISSLLRHKKLYPQLRDHESVLLYGNINGVDEQVQFIDHDEPEAAQQDSTSYSNPHEAKFIAAMCQYLLNQGYFPDQITVITPYMGQVLLLRREMPKVTFDGVRITAVDNFQGEENDIILLSLVRSSSYDKKIKGRNMIGFVGIENRICVSLSRAKMGLYVIGNFKLLESNSSMWEDIVCDMKGKGLVKRHVTLRCQNHKEQTVLAEKASDFEKVPNGGCKKPCEGNLPCGHKCPKSCHIIDRDHVKASCLMPCNKIVCEQGHRCKLKCFQSCGKCNTYVEKTVPMCGHIESMPCHMDPVQWKCRRICTYHLACGHNCNKSCDDCTSTRNHEQECQKEVIKTLPCKHTAKMKCFENVSSYICEVPCKEILSCKHSCSGKCGTCFYGKIHTVCKRSCGKRLPCGHFCSTQCSDVCPPCRKPCKWTCSHNVTCKKRCWEECDHCRDPCKYRCKHKKCEQECYEECNDGPCEERCRKKLSCGHTCRGKCGETCICIICSSDNLRNSIGDTFDDDTVFIQIPDCKCIFEIRRLDLHMEREITSRHDLCKHCPHCMQPITKDMKRYTNILKRARKSISKMYRILFGSTAYRKREIIQMNQMFQSLTKYGLAESELKHLVMQFQNPDNIGALHIAAQKFNKLKQLLPILQEIEIVEQSGMVFSNWKNVDSLVNPKLLRDILMKGRKLTTKQFWNEVQTEIDRLHLLFKLFLLQQDYSIRHKSSEVDSLFELAFQTLSNKELDENMIHTLKTTQESLTRFKNDDKIDEIVITDLSVRLQCLKCQNKRESTENLFYKHRDGSKLPGEGQLLDFETDEPRKVYDSLNFKSLSSETEHLSLINPQLEVTKVPDLDQTVYAVHTKSKESLSATNAEAGGLALSKTSNDISLGSDSFEPVSITTTQSFRENESTELTSEIEVVYVNEFGV